MTPGNGIVVGELLLHWLEAGGDDDPFDDETLMVRARSSFGVSAFSGAALCAAPAYPLVAGANVDIVMVGRWF